MQFQTAKPQRCILQRHHPHARGLVAAWPMDDAGGKIVRDAAGTNHGTAAADGKWVPGLSGGTAMTFNGSSDWVTGADLASVNFDGTVPMAMFAWLRALGGSGSDYFFVAKEANSNQYTGWYALIGNSESGGTYKLSATAAQHNATGHRLSRVGTNTNFSIGGWHHAGFTYDGSRSSNGIILYVDGGIEPSTSASNTWVSAQAPSGIPVTIGSRDAGGVKFNGSIHDVRIYNRALSASEVAEISRDPWAIYRPPGINIYAATALAHIAAYRQLRRRV